MPFLLGKKLKMTQIWQDDKVIPVTVIKAEPNTVSLTRTLSKHGYEAVQISTTAPRGKKIIKREFKTASGETAPKDGDTLTVSVFNPGDKVKATGTSRGKGFQGVVKRYNFRGGPKTHGQKHSHRAPGSIGAGGVQKVFKGTRMAGRTGGDTVTIKNLKVISVDIDKNELSLKGAVPGFKNQLLKIIKI